MKNLSLIVAIGKKNEIGKDNNLIWNLPKDLKFFKETTMDKTIIMGRKTFESLPGLLPKRKHIIITSDSDYKAPNTIIVNSVDEVITYITKHKEECFVIGGASIYKQLLPYCETLYITEIDDSSSDADTFFPSFKKDEYNSVELYANEDYGIKYKHIKYIKKGL